MCVFIAWKFISYSPPGTPFSLFEFIMSFYVTASMYFVHASIHAKPFGTSITSWLRLSSSGIAPHEQQSVILHFLFCKGSYILE